MTDDTGNIYPLRPEAWPKDEDINVLAPHVDKPMPPIVSGANKILQQAGKLIDGERDTQHGNRDDCLASITILWDAWDRIRQPGPPTSIDTCIKMVMVKLARIARGTHNRDNYVDGCGYLAMAGEQAEKANAL
jgi:hypothetical protein